jgi:UPF0271 protein
MVTDINVDLGELEGAEGTARELGLLPFATRINVACGFHAGDEETMRALCLAAAEHGVLVGAHIGYRDREHFGRRELATDPATLATDAIEQLGTLTRVAADYGLALSHVKPHGALYHRLAHDEEAAASVAAAIGAFGVLTLPQSALARAATRFHAPVLREGFADRAYSLDGSLIPRDRPGAVLDPEGAALQALGLARSGTVDTICVHGDNENAEATVRAVREVLGR